MAAVALLMQLKGVSQAELAERAGLSPSQLSRYLNGTTTPQLRQIFRLIDGLRVPDLAFWWTVSRVETIDGVLARGLDDDVLLRGVLEAILDRDDDGDGAGNALDTLLDAARHTNAANRAILEALAGARQREDAERGSEPD